MALDRNILAPDVLRPWSRGETITAERLNNIHDAIDNVRRVGVPKPNEVTYPSRPVPGTSLSPIVVRSVGETSIMFRAVEYIDDPPQEGRYQLVGDEDLVGYPDFGSTVEDYRDFETPGTIGLDTQFLKAYRRGGVWLIELPASGDLEIERFAYVSMQADYIVGRRSNGTQVAIAKPYLLRRTPFDGLGRGNVSYTYSSNTTRTAAVAGSGFTEEQVIVPYYLLGDVIVAAKVGVAITDLTVTGTDIVWLDLNDSARAWAWLITVGQ